MVKQVASETRMGTPGPSRGPDLFPVDGGLDVERSVDAVEASSSDGPQDGAGEQDDRRTWSAVGTGDRGARMVAGAGLGGG